MHGHRHAAADMTGHCYTEILTSITSSMTQHEASSVARDWHKHAYTIEVSMFMARKSSCLEGGVVEDFISGVNKVHSTGRLVRFLTNM